MVTVKSIFRVAAEAMAVFALFWLMRACTTYASDNFDKEVWHASAYAGTERRCGMVEDVQMNIARPGMTMQQIRTVLGAPQRTDGLKFEYDLGMCCPIDGATLDVHVDAAGRLTATDITEH